MLMLQLRPVFVRIPSHTHQSQIVSLFLHSVLIFLTRFLMFQPQEKISRSTPRFVEIQTGCEESALPQTSRIGSSRTRTMNLLEQTANCPVQEYVHCIVLDEDIHGFR
jgi:hypothetical protein